MTGAAPPVRAELEILSGRPNPAWELRAAEVDELAARLGRLRATARRRAEPGLGYRGVTVASPEAHRDLPAHMRVFDGVVSTTGARGEVAFDDTEHVEAWLLDSARRQGYGAILDDLGPSEGRPRGEVSPGPDGHGRD